MGAEEKGWRDVERRGYVNLWDGCPFYRIGCNRIVTIGPKRYAPQVMEAEMVALMKVVAHWEKEDAGKKPGDGGGNGRMRLPVVK